MEIGPVVSSICDLIRNNKVTLHQVNKSERNKRTTALLKWKVSFTFQLSCMLEDNMNKSWKWNRKIRSPQVAFLDVLTNIPFNCSENLWMFKERSKDRNHDWNSKTFLSFSPQKVAVLMLHICYLGSYEVNWKPKPIGWWSWWSLEFTLEVKLTGTPPEDQFSFTYKGEISP